MNIVKSKAETKTEKKNNEINLYRRNTYYLGIYNRTRYRGIISNRIKENETREWKKRGNSIAIMTVGVQ